MDLHPEDDRPYATCDLSTSGWSNDAAVTDKPLRIGMDARALQPPLAGIARYQLELCRRLGAWLPNAEFFLYTHRRIVMPTASARWHLRLDPWPAAARLKRIVWLKLRAGQLCRQDRLDVFWSADPFLPRLRADVPIVSVVHDINHLLYPATMHRPTLWASRLFFRRDLRRAQVLIAVSQGTRGRVHAATGVWANEVLPPAVGPQFRAPAAAEVDRIVHDQHHIQGRYVLSVATREPRKNLDAILDALQVWRGQPATADLQLVLVGAAGWRDEGLGRRIAGLRDHGVIALGFVPEEDLPALYAGCECLLCPSLYEGFGLPVIEARACGARIVTTDIPELHEAGGNAAVYIKPTATGILDGLTQTLAHPRPIVNRGDLPDWADAARSLAVILARTAADYCNRSW